MNSIGLYAIWSNIRVSVAPITLYTATIQEMEKEHDVEFEARIEMLGSWSLLPRKGLLIELLLEVGND